MFKICDGLGMLNNYFENSLRLLHMERPPNLFPNSTDAAFNREEWSDKKSCIIDYFNSRMHTKYVKHFIVFKVFSCAFIVSI